MPVRRDDLTEFHYIAHVDNIRSILAIGIVCHNRSNTLTAVSVASADVQSRRSKKSVPRGLPLHDYANLYFTARNPMLYVLGGLHEDLVVLRVDTLVLDLPNVVIADGNAASDPTAFYPSPGGLANLDGELIFAEDWRDVDVFGYWHKKRVKCAEVLVPKAVPREYITGGYVASPQAEARFVALHANLPVQVNPHLFFRG